MTDHAPRSMSETPAPPAPTENAFTSERLTVSGLRSLTDQFARLVTERRGGIMIGSEIACAVLIELQDKAAKAERSSSPPAPDAPPVKLEDVQDPDFTGGLTPVEYLDHLHAGTIDEAIAARRAGLPLPPTGIETPAAEPLSVRSPSPDTP